MTGPSTRAVHAGETPDPHTGASAPNLAMSTTFAQEAPGAFSINAVANAGANDAEPPYIYTRWGNPTTKMLEDKLAALEGAEDCVAFASGMAATAAVLFGALKPGDHLVMSDVNYAGTAELARGALAEHGVAATFVDTSAVENVEAAVRPATKMIWVETPANPTLRLADLAAIAALARQRGVVLAVDSTFATPVATRPLELGADLVVHSLTKYIGGHGDAVGGAVLGSREALLSLRSHLLVHFGGCISPFNAWLIARGAATLPIRMAAHERGALAVAAYLEEHPAVLRVNYPGLPSHPQHALAKRQMANFSGMISFQAKGGAALAEHLATALRTIHFAVSLGHHRSLIYYLDTASLLASSFKLAGDAEAAYRRWAGDGLFRLSVGLEDGEDICEDLDQALASAP